MAASSLALTVRSVGDNIITSTSMAFVVSRISELRTNQNPITTASVTEAGDGSNQLSTWKIYGTGDKLYWGLWAIAGTDYAVALYADATHTKMVAYGHYDSSGATGTIYGTPKNESGISFSVAYNYSGDDTGVANTVQCTTFVDSKDLELPGATQFLYDMGSDYHIKYTVDETVSSINASIDGDSQSSL